MKTWNFQVLDDEKRIFNYRLSRARRVVENVFDLVVNRFGVLKSKMSLSQKNTECVVFAWCVLHNFLRTNAPDKSTPHGSLDAEGENH